MDGYKSAPSCLVCTPLSHPEGQLRTRPACQKSSAQSKGMQNTVNSAKWRCKARILLNNHHQSLHKADLTVLTDATPIPTERVTPTSWKSECPCERASYDSSDANAMSLTLNKTTGLDETNLFQWNNLVEQNVQMVSSSTVQFAFFKGDLQPMSMRQIVNIFSASVLGETLPKPTDVRPVIVK